MIPNSASPTEEYQQQNIMLSESNELLQGDLYIIALKESTARQIQLLESIIKKTKSENEKLLQENERLSQENRNIEILYKRFQSRSIKSYQRAERAIQKSETRSKKALFAAVFAVIITVGALMLGPFYPLVTGRLKSCKLV